MTTDTTYKPVMKSRAERFPNLQVNHPKYNQRRVSCVKYLGELYNYRMVESAVIFKTLYSFITFGISLDGKLVQLPQFRINKET